MVRARTGFHANGTYLQSRKKLQHLTALQLFTEYNFSVTIHPMYLEYVLCQIQSNSANLHDGLLLLV